VQKIVSALTTGGYIVNKHYMPTVLEAFTNCNITHDYRTAIDSCWRKLQPEGNWFSLRPQIGTQSMSMSDIEGKLVDYTTGYSSGMA
jgi:hypothetical protein